MNMASSGRGRRRGCGRGHGRRRRLGWPASAPRRGGRSCARWRRRSRPSLVAEVADVAAHQAAVDADGASAGGRLHLSRRAARRSSRGAAPRRPACGSSSPRRRRRRRGGARPARRSSPYKSTGRARSGRRRCRARTSLGVGEEPFVEVLGRRRALQRPRQHRPPRARAPPRRVESAGAAPARGPASVGPSRLDGRRLGPGIGARSWPPECRSASSKKFSAMRSPNSVAIDSGWNSTPQIGRVSCSTPITTPSRPRRRRGLRARPGR